jgi:hypothetical protein
MQAVWTSVLGTNAMTDIVIVALIAAIPGTVAAIISGINKVKLDKVEIRVDGRLTQLLELTKQSSHAEGVKDEKEKH